MAREDHWNHVYETKESTDLSWFQATPITSMSFLEAAGLRSDTTVIDVGGGDSRLVDSLLDRGLRCVTVLDISSAAIARARARLSGRAQLVNWIVADVTTAWVTQSVDIWHDRALFHFLIDESDRARYVTNLRKALKPGGHAVIATFAPEGPAKCSGLLVRRYSSESLTAELGADFELVQSSAELHPTPIGTRQPFVHALFRLRG